MTARIGVIDDEAPNRAYLHTLLGLAGFEVQVATGGTAASYRDPATTDTRRGEFKELVQAIAAI